LREAREGEPARLFGPRLRPWVTRSPGHPLPPGRERARECGRRLGLARFLAVGDRWV